MDIQEACKNLKAIINPLNRIIEELETYLLTKPKDGSPLAFATQALSNLLADYGQDISNWIDQNLLKDVDLKQIISYGVDISNFDTMIIEDLGVLITALTQFISSVSKSASDWEQVWNKIQDVFSSVKTQKTLPGIDEAVTGYKKIAEVAEELEAQLLLGNSPSKMDTSVIQQYNNAEDDLIQSFNELSELAHALKVAEQPTKLESLLANIEAILHDLLGSHVDISALINHWMSELKLDTNGTQEALAELVVLISDMLAHPTDCITNIYADIVTSRQDDGTWLYTSPTTNTTEAVMFHDVPWWLPPVPSTVNWFFSSDDLNSEYKQDPYFDWPDLLQIGRSNETEYINRLNVAVKALGTEAIFQAIQTPKKAIYYLLRVQTPATITETSLSSIINNYLIEPSIPTYKTHTLIREASQLALHLQEIQSLEVTKTIDYNKAISYFKQEDIPQLLYSPQNPYKLLIDAQNISKLYFEIKDLINTAHSSKEEKTVFKFITISSQANSVDILIQLLEKYSDINSQLYKQLPEFVNGIPFRQSIYDSVNSWMSPIRQLLTQTGNYITAFIYIPVYYLMVLYLLIWVANEIEESHFTFSSEITVNSKEFTLLLIQSVERVIDAISNNMLNTQPLILITAITTLFNNLLKSLPFAGQVSDFTNAIDSITQLLANLQNGACADIWSKVEPLLFDIYWDALKKDKTKG